MQPLLFLTVGLPGSGKTTKAIKFESEYNALRLTKDEWVMRLLGSDSNRTLADSFAPLVEKELWSIALRAIDLGNNVIIDFGLWAIEERAQFRTEAEQHGAKVYFVICEEPFDTLWGRVSARAESQSGSLHITYQDMKDFWNRYQPITEDERQYAYEGGTPPGT